MGKDPAATIFSPQGTMVYDPLLLLLPLFSLFFNWVSMTFLGLVGTLSTSAAARVADIADFLSHTHTHIGWVGGRGYPSSSSRKKK
jgi:hypothetical protein